ncbi:MAG: cobyrinate a,c-diamide synthase, partial [Sulfurovum sp.]|nr:cobyrinate a,c-diamide synthase [Sulfurovaceae bacterium]
MKKIKIKGSRINSKKALIISAIASSEGKTLMTMALLRYFNLQKVRPFKIGPDFIDPQFHKKVSGTPSVNLDGYMMNRSQVKWVFHKYKRDINICEGVMGFYDGMDKSSSAYDIGRILNIPTLLILNGGGSYITVSAILKGLLEFRDDNTIKAVVINHISSQMHFELIKKYIEIESKDIVIIGWIGKNLQTIQSRYLGLDLEELEILELDRIADEVLKNIDMSLLNSMMQIRDTEVHVYPFKDIIKKDKKCILVND